MKIPINWLNEFVTLPKDIKKLTSDLTFVGHMLDKIEVKNGGTVIDLELRGNRADCYSILGIAREVSAIYGERLKNIQIVQTKKVKELKNVYLDVQTSLVKRVGMIEIKNIKILKSPKWLSNKLISYGIESINNIVDLTNYVMIETGEPMHAFDLDKIGNNLEIRLAKKNEKITTFQNNTITLTPDDLVWAKDDKILSVAGSIGEKYNSISETTKNILLEAANYDRANIRRTVYRHNLLTEAGIRHEKELDPNMVDLAIGRFLHFIQKYDWGKFKSEVYDYYPKKINPLKLILDLGYLKSLSGVDIEIGEIKIILQRLSFELIKVDKNKLTVLVPTFRTDVKLEEDLIEEIIRIYGYDKIPAKTLSLEIPSNITPKFILQEQRLRQSAVSVGFNEIISLSFIQEKYLLAQTINENVSVINAPSPDTKYLRDSLFPNLLETAKKIINERSQEVSLFEIGKVYQKEKSKYLEKRRIGFIYWHANNNTFPDFKSLILTFFDSAEIKNLEFKSEIINLNFTNSYLLMLTKDLSKSRGEIIGFGGKHKDVYYAEIDLDSILEKEEKYNATLWPKFPPQIEDITLQIPEKTYIGEVIQLIKSVNNLITKIELIDTFKDNYTFNIEYQNPDKTLTDDEVKEIRYKILSKLKERFGISIKE